MTIGRPCQQCGRVIKRGRLCPACRRPSEERRRAAQARVRERHEELHPEVAKLYRSRAWARVRAAAVERDGGCVIGRGCRGQLEVHHLDKLTGKKQGDPLDLDRLVTLCSRHHRLVESGSLRLKTAGHR